MITLCCILALLTFIDRSVMPDTQDQGFFYALNPNNAACYPRGKVVMALQYPIVDVSSGKGHAAVIVSCHFNSLCNANTNDFKSSSSNTGSAGSPASLKRCSKISNRAFPKTGEHSLYLSIPNFQWRWKKFRTSHLSHDGKNLFLQSVLDPAGIAHRLCFGQPVHAASEFYTDSLSVYRFFIAHSKALNMPERIKFQNSNQHATQSIPS